MGSSTETVHIFFTDSYDGHSSHDLLDEVMRRFTGRHDFELRIKKGGKPYFAEADAPLFSISHSGSVWICAAASREVGVDIQLHGRMPRYKNIVKRYFHPDEAELIERSDSPKPLFFDIWSKKEAVAKLRGDGIDANFKKINTAASDCAEFVCAFELPITHTYSAAIACDVNFDITITKLTLK